MARLWNRLVVVTIGSVLAVPVSLLLSNGSLPLGQVSGWSVMEKAALAQAQPTFSAGEQVVVKLEDGYYLATVDKVYQENGFTMVDFSWQVEGGEGSGTYPADHPNFWFTIEEANRQSFKILNASADSSQPTTNSTDTSSQPNQSQPAPTSQALAADSSNSSCPGASQLTSSEIQEILRIHNQARAEVGVPPVTWNCKLAEFSQKWVNQGQWQHSSSDARRQVIANTYVGENLASAAPASQPIATIGPTGWWKEKQFWSNTTGQCQPGKVCGHYTQMVWRNTKEIGCGVNRKASVLGPSWAGNSAYLACTYNPGGNYVGQKPY